jgi:hypothetical protein
MKVLIAQKVKLEKQKLHVLFLVPSSMSRCKFWYLAAWVDVNFGT